MMQPSSIKLWMAASPSPLMSMAVRPTKLRMWLSSWAGQLGFWHLMSEVSGSRTAGAPQTGQVVPMTKGSVPAGRFSLTTSLTFGMISPDL